MEGKIVDDTIWVDPPLVVADASSSPWDDEADLIVVGLGAAGIAAALEACEQGLSVIVVERFDGGGASAISGGIYYAGATDVQREAGIEDSLDSMYTYLERQLGEAVSNKTLRVFVDENVENLGWLRRHGVHYKGTLYSPKTAFPPDGYYLYYSGNERLAEYAELAKPAPRGHRAYDPGNPHSPSGMAMMGPLLEALGRSSVRILRHAPVTRLIRDAKDKVIGIEAAVLPDSEHAAHMEAYAKVLPVRTRLSAARAADAIHRCRALERSKGQSQRIRARLGVVLAAGGFINNPAWMAKYGTVDYSKGVRMGRIGCDGSGIALGLSTGGVTAMMNRIFAAVKLSPPEAYAHGLLVNPAGRRFRNEESYVATLGSDVTEKYGGKAWLILDRNLFLKALRQCLPDGTGRFTTFYAPVLLNLLLGGTRIAGSLKTLAKRCGLDRDALLETVAEANRAAEGTAPDPFGRAAEYRHALRHGPFIAVNLAVDNPWSFTTLFTLGGLVIDEPTGSVLRDDGTTIKGLYAAGRTAVGLCSENYVSGMSISDCIFSGRRAARSIAASRSSHVSAERDPPQ